MSVVYPYFRGEMCPTCHRPTDDDVGGLRQYLRDYCPPGPYSRAPGLDGFTAEDIDLVIRRFGPLYGLDQDGDFALIEVKHGRQNVPWDAKQASKDRLFRVMDKLLRAGDSVFVGRGEPSRYRGSFWLREEISRGEFPWWADSKVNLNGEFMTVREFAQSAENGFMGIVPMNMPETTICFLPTEPLCDKCGSMMARVALGNFFRIQCLKCRHVRLNVDRFRRVP